MRNHPLYRDMVGTGWVIAPGIVVTNRHVAKLFAEKTTNGKFAFKENDLGSKIFASIDFKKEFPQQEIWEVSKLQLKKLTCTQI